MKEMLKKKLQERKKKGNEKGFTLIEILVVLVIMGFLVAMVAPKLAGVSDRAVDVTDQNSQKRLQETVQAWINMNDSIPPGLATMATTVDTTWGGPDVVGDYIMASVDDNNSGNGAEVISKDFADKWLPMPHYLNGAEATEMKGMIGSAMMQYALVGTLTDTDTNLVQDVGTQGDIVERYLRKPIRGNQCVMMIGAGFNDTGADQYAMGPTATLTGSTLVVTTPSPLVTSTALAAAAPQLTTGSNYIAGPLVYAKTGDSPVTLRIVMGLTDRSKIAQGLLDKAGISPKATQSDNYEFGNYYIVLPRLQATVDRFKAGTGLAQDANFTTDTDVVLHAISFNEEPNGTFIMTSRTPSNANTSGRLLGAEELTEAFVLSPEGSKWAGNRADFFGIGLALGKGKP